MSLFGVLGIFIFIIALDPLVRAKNVGLDRQILIRAEQDHGPGARRRLEKWSELIQDGRGLTERQKLARTNDFFNQTVMFVEDILHWGKEDYWATPVEFLASQAGDCEDFSLAKYFTLIAQGVAEDKLYLTYVKSLTLNQAHMVLTYYETPSAEPLVLDNLINEIKPASQRKDLVPVYSFNGSGLWLAKQRGRGQLVGGSDRLKRWQDLLRRMPSGVLPR